MNTVSIDGKNYVKATDIARVLGYTTDYIGQLCRAKKVEAQLVGRSWYVNEESARTHKQTRYSKSKAAPVAKNQKEIKTRGLDSENPYLVAVSVEAAKPSSSYAEERFYSRAPQVAPSAYFKDESELIPESQVLKQKTGRLPVQLGDAQSVRIKSKNPQFDFEPTQRSEIRFSGALSIADVEDTPSEDVEEEVEKVNIDPKTVKVSIQSPEVVKKPEPKPEKSNHIKVKHIRPSTAFPKKKLPIEHNTTGIIGMKRGYISAKNPAGGTLKVAVPADNPSLQRSGIHFVLLSATVSVTLAVLILGLETTSLVENATIVSVYTFKLETLLAAVSAAL